MDYTNKKLEYFKFKDIKKDLISLKKDIKTDLKSDKELNSILDKISYWIKKEGFILDPQDIIKPNKKLSKNTCDISTNSAINCMYRLNGGCKLCNKCYSFKHDNWLPINLFKTFNKMLYFYNTPNSQIIQDIKKGGYNKIRFNVSGDIEYKSQLNKIIDLIKLAKKNNITCTIYTKNKQALFELVQLAYFYDNLFILDSNSYLNLDIIKNKQIKQYKSVEKIPKNAAAICQGNCSICDNCYSDKNQVIYCKIH